MSEKRLYSEPFATWFRILLEERVSIDERKAAGTYVEPAATSGNYADKTPPSIKQLKYLKSLGCEIVPGTKNEASRLISEFLRGKGG